MAFVDLLRMTVLLAAAAATVLAAVTAIVVGTTGDTLTLFVALGWWLIALVGGLILGRPEGAVAAIEERDGVRFYVEPGSALQPVRLIRTPGLRRERPPPGHPPPPPTAAA
jgi:hypothetical protein